MWRYLVRGCSLTRRVGECMEGGNELALVGAEGGGRESNGKRIELRFLDAVLACKSLQLHAKRTELFAAYIANADRPNYKARDIDSRAAQEWPPREKRASSLRPRQSALATPRVISKANERSVAHRQLVRRSVGINLNRIRRRK